MNFNEPIADNGNRVLGFFGHSSLLTSRDRGSHVHSSMRQQLDAR